MDESTVAALVDEGVVRTTPEGDIELGADFRAAFDDRLAEIRGKSPAERGNLVETHADDPGVRSILDDDRAAADELFAAFVALGTALSDTDEQTRLQLAVFLAQFHRGHPPDEGCPDYFVPVDADVLPVALAAFDRAVVYVWREDCPPCDLMREDLAAIAADRDGLACFAVYGPDWAGFLDEAYDVVGAPTTLFVADGRVDARLHGAHYRDVIVAELEKTTG